MSELQNIWHVSITSIQTQQKWTLQRPRVVITLLWRDDWLVWEYERCKGCSVFLHVWFIVFILHA